MKWLYLAFAILIVALAVEQGGRIGGWLLVIIVLSMLLAFSRMR